MKAFFAALGIVVSGIVIVILTLVLTYVSYVLALGIALILIIFAVYKVIKISGEDE